MRYFLGLLLLTVGCTTPSTDAPILSDGLRWNTVTAMVADTPVVVVGTVSSEGLQLDAAPANEPSMMLKTYEFVIEEVLKGDLSVGDTIILANHAEAARVDGLSPIEVGQRLLIGLVHRHPAPEQEGAEFFPDGVFVPRGGSDGAVFNVSGEDVVQPRSSDYVALRSDDDESPQPISEFSLHALRTALSADSR